MTDSLKARLVIIETVSKQNYVFGSNRLRECVGASQLISLSGTQWVFEAIDSALGAGGLYAALYDRKGREMTIKILAAPRHPVEVIVATSGKAILLIEERGDAEALGRRIVEAVTRRALSEAPGLTVRGAIGEAFDPDGDASEADRAINKTHKRLAANRHATPPPEARFPTLPVFAPCASTGAPANGLARLPEGDTALSAEIMAKRAAAPDGALRVQEGTGCDDLAFNPETLNQIEDWSKGLPWLATIHADGNGFGAVFQRFLDHHRKKGADSARAYLNAYREFSLALDVLGLDAFTKAASKVALRKKDQLRPLVPLVMGGDDLTVICAGVDALAFTEAYLCAFSDGAALEPAITRLVGNEIGAAAGVALVKPHHPFHHAYALSEALCASAKQAKHPVGSHACALDWHLHHDGSALSLEAQREGWRSRDLSLTMRPYILDYEGGHCWGSWRRFEALQEAAQALKQGLPRSQQHALRDAAFRAIDDNNADRLDNRLRLIQARYPAALELLAVKGSLFQPDGNHESTRLLDAMDLIDLGAASGAQGEDAA